MPASQESTTTRAALVVLAVIASGAALYLLADILAPLALAVFLAVMVDGFARVLQRRLPLLPRRAALPLAIVLSVALFGGAAFFVADNAAGFITQLVAYVPKLDRLIAQAAAMAGAQTPPTLNQMIHQLDAGKYLGQAARGLQGFTSTAAFVLVYLGFLIASRRGWERKVVGLFPVREERQDFVGAFLRIRDGVEQYLWVQTVTGLMIAVASWLAMMAMGLDNALFWAFLIFLASYIPVVGGVVAVAAPPIFALVQFDSYWQAITLFVVLQAITMFVGNVVQPRMQSRSLNIDPVVVLLALAFWGAVWGLTGAFLSTPLTVMIMVICAQFEGGRWVAVLLSADGDPLQLAASRPTLSPAATRPKPTRRRKAGG